MTILPPVDETSCAQIAMLLDHMPRERATEVLQSSATQFFEGAVAKGWTPRQADELTIGFVSSVLRHWQSAAACRLQ